MKVLLSAEQKQLGPRLSASLFVVATLLLLVGGYAAAGRDAEHCDLDDQKQGVGEKIQTYYGVADCRGCHDNAAFGDPKSSTSRYTEILTWEKEDKHALAHKVLSDKRAQGMGKLLGYADVTKEPACIACHSIHVAESPDIKSAASFSLDEGVSCAACHGPEIFERQGQALEPSWVLRHSAKGFFRDEWRKLPRDFKQSKYGMNDLWDPVKRTQLCASCHIGNVTQGKQVTHEMYAAGHPPLPGFEVVTFSRQMPGHWQYLREKPAPVQKILGVSKREADLEETNLLAIGALVASQEYLKILAAHGADNKKGPELANYDCYACHHDLTSKSWRQERGYAGVPGRPTLREWPTALAEVGLVHAASDTAEADKLISEFRTSLDAIQTVLNDKPFGELGALQTKAKGLSDWIEKPIQMIRSRIALDEKAGGYGVDSAAKLLAHVLELQERSKPASKVDKKLKLRAPDFDSARQLAWAHQVLNLETLSKHDPKQRDQFYQDMKKQKEWTLLNEKIGLVLMPEGQMKIETALDKNLDRIKSYVPSQYFEAFGMMLNSGKK